MIAGSFESFEVGIRFCSGSGVTLSCRGGRFERVPAKKPGRRARKSLFRSSTVRNSRRPGVLGRARGV
jgi:hypothetical protein